MKLIYTVLIFTALHTNVYTQKWAKVYTQKVWEGEEINLYCDPKYTILITTANYGRADPNVYRIYNREYENVTCKTLQSTGIVRNICNKKNECLVKASSSLFGDPCPGQDKYLEVSFMCIRDNS